MTTQLPVHSLDPASGSDGDGIIIAGGRFTIGPVTSSGGGSWEGGDPAWIAPTLKNSWVNYGDPTWAPAGYRKDAAGVVHLRGLVKSGTLGAAALTLPVGYRPAYQTIFIVDSSSGPRNLAVWANGDVTFGGTTNTYVYLDSVSFIADDATPSGGPALIDGGAL